MAEAVFLLWGIVLGPVLVVVLILNLVLGRRRRDPTPPGGWPAPPVVSPMQMTVLSGPVCACGGPLQVASIDLASRQPSVLRCQVCGMESTLGPWAVLRERSR